MVVKELVFTYIC